MGRLAPPGREPARSEPAPAGLTTAAASPESEQGPVIEHEVKALRDPEVQYAETDRPAVKIPLTSHLTMRTIPTVSHRTPLFATYQLFGT